MKKGIKVVLLVGLIGSGKSTILRELASCGAGILLMDELWNQEIYQEHFRNKLCTVLGEDVLHADGSPNKERLRALFFSCDPEEQKVCLERQEKLFSAFSDFFLFILRQKIMFHATCADSTMIVIEGASALTNGWYEKLAPDATVVLHCDKEIRLQRILGRNPNVSRETYLAIMEMQSTDEQLLAAGAAVKASHITTECSFDEMRDIAHILHNRLIEA